MPRLPVLVLSIVLLVASSAICASAAKGSKNGNVEKGKNKSGPVIFNHEGQRWTIHKDEQGRAFFYNVESGKAQWSDPRQAPLTASERTLAVVLFGLPFALMIVGAAGYIYWVRTKHPELLKGPKKVKGLKNWQRALLPPKVAKPKERGRSASPTPEEVKKAD